MTDPRRPLVAGLMGWPVHQSKSPIIHNHWLDSLGIDGVYSCFPVKPGDAAAALRAMGPLGVVGMQATMPHKRDCFEAVDSLSDAARALGAVNTITVQPDGSLRGHNTDFAGFLEPLAEKDLSDRPVTILGAGGAAAAVTVGLVSKGASEIRIINRSSETIAKMLGDIGEALGPVDIVTGDWSQLAARLGDSALLVNTTSLGMAGQPALEVDVAMLPDDAAVYDIVTHPYNTDLLKAAYARGLATYDGLQMLIGQAREAFELFYGQTAPARDDAAVRAKLIA